MLNRNQSVLIVCLLVVGAFSSCQSHQGHGKCNCPDWSFEDSSASLDGKLEQA